MSRKVDLSDLQAKLILRPGMQRVDLNLDHLGRELIYKGDLMRMGGNRFTWLETHALLFDHYMIHWGANLSACNGRISGSKGRLDV